MTKSEETICISVPILQILWKTSPRPRVTYAYGFRATLLRRVVCMRVPKAVFFFVNLGHKCQGFRVRALEESCKHASGV